MLRLAADEDFHAGIVRGLRRRVPELDLVTVQAAGLRRAVDSAVLAWATEAGRVLLTHDVTTLVPLAYQRIQLGQPMAGVFAVHQHSPF
jgi:predicted nuclease of predicted toxin-antitoxin system